MQFTKRGRQRGPNTPLLYYTKCFELANHYLGFNGWSIEKVNSKKADLLDTPEDAICIVTSTKLQLLGHNLQVYGYGVSQHTWNSKDKCSKGVALAKCHKVSYQNAIQDAFSKVLLVVLDNGKVYPEVNTTIYEHLNMDMHLDTENLLKVQELEDEQPETEAIVSNSVEQDSIDVGNLEELNIQILNELDNA